MNAESMGRTQLNQIKPVGSWIYPAQIRRYLREAGSSRVALESRSGQPISTEALHDFVPLWLANPALRYGSAQQ